MRDTSIVFGTRPEALKLMPLVMQLKDRCWTCVTGQHREMLDQVLKAFNYRPDVDLDLMVQGQSIGQFASMALGQLDGLFDRKRPGLVIVQGDTATALSAALAAFYRKIPVAHVEAGLRSRELYSPWPEEGNRAMISRIASVHFAPTYMNMINLIEEKVDSAQIFVTGNTIVDSLRMAKEMMAKSHTKTWEGPLVTMTCHRRENESKLAGFFEAVVKLASRFPEVKFICPIHPNPKVKAASRSVEALENVYMCGPLDYLSFIDVLSKSLLILTDSGGVQEEAVSLGRPVLVMRDTTERPEILDNGYSKLVGTDQSEIIAEASRWIQYPPNSHPVDIFGDGHSAEKIAGILDNLWKSGQFAESNNPSG